MSNMDTLQTQDACTLDNDGRTLVTGRDYNESVSIGTLGRWTSHVVKRAATESVSYVLAEIQRQDQARQIVEDQRANHRNLNRFLTLMGALLIGLAVTFLLTNDGIPGVWQMPESIAKPLAPYTFVITIFMDSALAAYAWVRKY